MKLASELREFFSLWWDFIARHAKISFWRFESFKKGFAELLYRQRGKFARPFVHSGMFALVTLGVMLGPIISEGLPSSFSTHVPAPSAVLSAATENPATVTLVSGSPKTGTEEYTVLPGDTVLGIAEKYGVSAETILWQNDLEKNAKLKPGQVLEVLTVTGVSHKVKRGETIYSIAKKYQTDAQGIIDFPFNTFVNDETFALAVGQVLIIPEGTPPKETPTSPYLARRTPDAGTVVASGRFVWPASGNISQGFAWYHRAIDIANSAAPNILAADSGTVLVAGWPDNVGYGNRIIIDHGNGYRTLYAHLAGVYVVPGQTVERGDAVGKMGSTGRSSGVHVHFEIHGSGGSLNPLALLQ